MSEIPNKQTSTSELSFDIPIQNYNENIFHDIFNNKTSDFFKTNDINYLQNFASYTMGWPGIIAPERLFLPNYMINPTFIPKYRFNNDDFNLPLFISNCRSDVYDKNWHSQKSTSQNDTFTSKYLIKNLIKTEISSGNGNNYGGQEHLLLLGARNCDDSGINISNFYNEKSCEFKKSSSSEELGENHDLVPSSNLVEYRETPLLVTSPTTKKKPLQIESLVHTITPGLGEFRSGICKILEHEPVKECDRDNSNSCSVSQNGDLDEQDIMSYDETINELKSHESETLFDTQPDVIITEPNTGMLNYLPPPYNLLDTRKLSYYLNSSLNPYSNQFYNIYGVSNTKQLDTISHTQQSNADITKSITGRVNQFYDFKLRYKKLVTRKVAKSSITSPRSDQSLTVATPRFLVKDLNGNIRPEFGVLSHSYEKEDDAKNVNKNGRGRRQRTIFSGDQTSKLEKEFKKCEYVSREQRQELARALYLSESQVKIWFQNRRAKDKRIEKASSSTDHFKIGHELEDPRMQGCCLIRACPPFGMRHYTQKYLKTRKLSCKELAE